MQGIHALEKKHGVYLLKTDICFISLGFLFQKYLNSINTEDLYRNLANNSLAFVF